MNDVSFYAICMKLESMTFWHSLTLASKRDIIVVSRRASLKIIISLFKIFFSFIKSMISLINTQLFF